jgi:hypothetical protein
MTYLSSNIQIEQNFNFLDTYEHCNRGFNGLLAGGSAGGFCATRAAVHCRSAINVTFQGCMQAGI